MRDGSWDRRNHRAGVNFLVFTTVSQRGAPEGIGNGGAVLCPFKGGKWCFYGTFIFDSYSFRCWEESNMTAVSLPPVTAQLLGKHAPPPGETLDPPAHSVFTILPLFLTRGGSHSFQPHPCENNPASNTLSLQPTHM